jgi:uncharacterized membrane protein
MLGFGREKFTKSRVEAFSDGVFAIIVTLLVLDIKIPALKTEDNQAMFDSIIGILPIIFIWMTSFLITCVIWMNHHRIMGMINHIDSGIFWLNNLLLMASSLIPFPTAMVGAHPKLAAATIFYGICLMFTALCFVFMRLYILKTPGMLKAEVTRESFWAGTRRTLFFGCSFYLVGAAVSWIDTRISFAVFFFIPLYFILPTYRSSSEKK